jgi:hypothetical protein
MIQHTNLDRTDILIILGWPVLLVSIATNMFVGLFVKKENHLETKARSILSSKEQDEIARIMDEAVKRLDEDD